MERDTSVILTKHSYGTFSRLGGKRGAGVPGYGVWGPGLWKTRGVENVGLVENAESGGKRGVWWKTQGLVENAGYHFFGQNMNFPHENEKPKFC